MADISQIQVGSTTYNIKDATARAAIAPITGSFVYTMPIFNGFIRGASKNLRIYVPTGYIVGKNISVSISGDMAVRTPQGYVFTEPNYSGTSISAAKLAECTIQVLAKSAFGFTMQITPSGKFYMYNSEYASTTNVPLNVMFNGSLTVTVS